MPCRPGSTCLSLRPSVVLAGGSTHSLSQLCGVLDSQALSSQAPITCFQ